MISNAMAQALTPVTNVGGFDWWPLVIVAVVAAVIAGLVVWHKRNPTQQAAVLTKTNADLAAAAIALRDALHALSASSGTIIPKPVEAPPPLPGPTPEQLAAIDAAQASLDAAKRSAGINP